jgi:hypothetical protein
MNLEPAVMEEAAAKDVMHLTSSFVHSLNVTIEIEWNTIFGLASVFENF